MHNYSDTFYDYINEGSKRSAAAIVPLLAKCLAPRSVLDIGCGEGAWLAAWRRQGATDVTGVDGPYVNRTRLLIPEDQFQNADVSHEISLGRTFDLAQSLEVAEHLPERASKVLVRTLCSHSPVVYFSASVPGQGGENHINEQKPQYWRELFAEHGYVLADFLRPRIAHERSIEPWYRFNSFLYVARERLQALPAEIHNSVLPEHAPVPVVAPLGYRIRCAALAGLPPRAVTGLARAKHMLVLWRRGLSRSAPSA